MSQYWFTHHADHENLCDACAHAHVMLAAIALLGFLTHAYEEFICQLAIPWVTRHLTSPELAGTSSFQPGKGVIFFFDSSHPTAGNAPSLTVHQH